MKEILKDKIINIDNNLDNRFLLNYLDIDYTSSDREVFFMWELLKKYKNQELFNSMWNKYWMYNNVYSQKDEMNIFKELYDYAFNNNKKIHIVGITLQEELDLLEKYYFDLWFLREDINCFSVDFSIPLVTVSVNIENLIWRWSDYKRMWKEIFFIPPIREAWLTKSMYKWINRWVIMWIHINDLDNDKINFLENCIKEEHILPLTMWKVLSYNSSDSWFTWQNKKIIINY